MGAYVGEFAYDNSTNWTNAIYNFLALHDNRVSLSNGKIRFENKFSLTFDESSSTLTFDSDSSTKTIMSGNPYWSSSGTCKALLINGVNYLYLMMYRDRFPFQASTGFVIFKSDSGAYYAGGATGQTTDCQNINSILIYNCIDKDVAACKFGHIANYSLITPNILYSKKIPVVLDSGSGNVDFISAGISGSSVAYGSTITVDGKNYYVIGTNVFVPVD